MKTWYKRLIILSILLIAAWIVLKATGLKFYKIPTGSMENTILIGTRVMVWDKNFKPERFEIIVYHNPDYDTVIVQNRAISYYTAQRMWGRETVEARYTKQYLPIEKRDHFLGRCVGLPGDKIRISDGKLFVNGELYENDNIKKTYALEPEDKTLLTTKFFESNGIRAEEIMRNEDYYQFTATNTQIENLLKNLSTDTSFYVVKSKDNFDPLIFPYIESLKWNSDFFGEIQIPQKGNEILLTLENLAIYNRLIETFETNELHVDNKGIYINGKLTDRYIPKKDYYFIINDNRDNSFDSRYWGFLPEDHISGKVLKKFK